MEDKTQVNPGLYQADIVGQQMGESSGGHPQLLLSIKVTAKVVSEAHVEPIDPVDRTIYMVITDKSVPYVVKDLRAIGFVGGSWAFLDPDIPGYHNLSGATITVDCEHSTYEGTTRERWTIHSQREAKKLAPEGIRKLDAMFGKALKEGAPAATQAAPVPAQPQAAPQQPVATHAPEDVPF